MGWMSAKSRREDSIQDNGVAVVVSVVMHI